MVSLTLNHGKPRNGARVQKGEPPLLSLDIYSSSTIATISTICYTVIALRQKACSPLLEGIKQQRSLLTSLTSRMPQKIAQVSTRIRRRAIPYRDVPASDIHLAHHCSSHIWCAHLVRLVACPVDFCEVAVS